MQIKLDLKVFIFILFFFVTKQLEIYIYLMIFALLHEFGHLGMGMTLGIKPQNLKVMPVGFAISFKVDTKNYNKKYGKSNLLSIKKLAIALAGPAVNLIFIIIFFIEKQNIIFAYINILIFTFNMLPLYPLDGGRVLKYILYLIIRKGRSFKVNTYNIKYNCYNAKYFCDINSFLYEKYCIHFFTYIYMDHIDIRK